MTTEQITKLAENALKAIKKAITEEKKNLKEHPYIERAYPYVELGITMKHGWIGAENEKYRLTINPHWFNHDKHIAETDTRSDLERVINTLFGLLNKQNEVKGWKTLKVVRDNAFFGTGWYREKVEYPAMVCLLNEPCKEFRSLQNYIKKFSDYTIPEFTIFNVRMGGKRGELYCEEGERIYLDNRPKKCAEVLANLRKYRGTKDTINLKFGTEKWIDPIDEAYSCRHEIECDGEKRSYVILSVTSPTGKHKFEQKVY